jgi:hypothetical protein
MGNSFGRGPDLIIIDHTIIQHENLWGKLNLSLVVQR